MTVNICTVSQCLSIETRDKIFEIEIFDYRGKIWERSFTMVVVASSAITVIEDFSKDTLGRYDLNYIIWCMNGVHGRHDFFCSIFEKLQENTRYCYEHQRSQHNRYHRTVTHECFQLRVKVSLELCEITE